MRLFGILLIPVILLAAGGFVYLATQDWKGRQTINAAGMRHLLLLQGLPLDGPDFTADDETPFKLEGPGDKPTRTVSKKLLERYFADNTAGAPAPEAGPDGTPTRVSLAVSTPVTSQVAEVKRVYGVVKAELGKEGLAGKDKAALAGRWLLLQAETLDERIDYQMLLSATGPDGKPKTDEQWKAAADELEKRLYAKFDVVLAAPQPSDSPIAAAPAADAPAVPDKERLEKSAAWRAGATLDETDRRVRLAHLLIHLDQDASWQKRVAVVVGLRRYVQVIATQAERFKEMAARVEKMIPEDQATFVITETTLREKATQGSERAKAVAELRAKMTEQKTKEDDAVTRRQTQLKDLTDQLNKIKAEVDALLVRQSAIEGQLFEIQREVALTLDEVYRLEKLLSDTERERYGLPPRPAGP
jgi:hypothetical protein